MDTPYIFISYSTKDKQIANAICHYLEENGVACWIDHRELMSGQIWTGEIVKAIKKSEAMVLVYSANSNASTQVAAEVNLAFSKGKTIIPFLVDETPMKDNIEYCLAQMHWLVAYPDYRETFTPLLKAVKQVYPSISQYSGSGSLQKGIEGPQFDLSSDEVRNAGNVQEITDTVESIENNSEENLEEIYKQGMAYVEGDDVPQDYSKALLLLSKAANQGHTEAQCVLGHMYSQGLGTEVDYEEAIKWLTLSAEKDDSDAQCLLGQAFLFGRGVEKDYEKAFEWFLKSAEQGDETAQWFLGKMYEDGEGVEKDYIKALQWFLKSAEQGDADAQFSLGDMYYNGLGVKENYTEALQWFQKSAEQDNSDAQCCLGEMYYLARGVKEDNKKALDWFLKAADQGDSDAQFYIGKIYENGDGVEKDYTKALQWYLKAADQGDSDAQFKLGEMFLKGRGVEKNDEGAVKWFLQAAEQGYAEAQYNLGNLYYYGTGVEKDIEEAQKWYSKAAEQGHENAEKNLRWVNRSTKADLNTLAKVSGDSQNKGEVEGSDCLLDDGNLTKEVGDSNALNALTPKWNATVTEKQKSIIEKMIENMVYVEGGEVELGATAEQLKLAEKDEKPSHWIRLSSYWINRYVVTQEEWEGIMNHNPSKFQYHGEKNPVESVSFKDCEQFVKELKRLSGIDFALPSEAQWEFAARGGMRSQGYIYSGSDDIKEVAWSEVDNLKKTQPVGMRLPNELGLYDMSGNVAEWCDDVKGKYTDSFIVDPQYAYKAGFWVKDSKVIRGGGYDGRNGDYRVSARFYEFPENKSEEIGVRLIIKIIPSTNKAVESKEEGAVNKNLAKEDSKSNKKQDIESTSVAKTTSVEEKTTMKECPDNKAKEDISSKSKEGTSLKSAPIQSEESQLDSSEALSDALVARWSSDITDLQKETINNIIIKNMVYVEGGELMLGATPEQLKWANKDEKPAHKVRMSPYYICRYPVTQKVWESIMNNNPSKFKGPQRPVESVNFNEAQGFVDELKRLSGIFFALPSEAQWEFAARGGVKTRNYVYAGSNDLAEVAKTDIGATYKVGYCKPNELGLYGMSGNVSEWCDDEKGKYTDAFIVDPQYSYKAGFWASGDKVYRGGSYLYPKDCRVSYRASGTDTLKLSTLGLRLIVKIVSTSHSYDIKKLMNSKEENISPK